MSKRQIAVITVLALLSLAALGLSAVAIVRPGASPLAALAAAVACLGLAQLIALVFRTLREGREHDRVRDLMHMSTGIARDVSSLSVRVDRLVDKQAAAAAPAGYTVPRTLNLGPEQKVQRPAAAAEPRTWRDTLQTTDGSLRKEPGPTDQEEPKEPRLDNESPQAKPAPASGLMLEPVVQLAGNQTFAYRARVTGGGLAGPSGGPGEIFEKVAPVLRLLQRKGRDISIFCPVSAAELAAPAYLERLTGFLKDNSDIARQIAIELTQETLAGLDGEGAAGLGGIAQNGVDLVLSRCQPESPDLDALKALGFRYLEYDLAELIARDGWRLFDEGGPMTEAAEAAGDHGLMVIAGNVNGKREAELAQRFATLARGSHFARPRLVRADLTDTSERAAA